MPGRFCHMMMSGRQRIEEQGTMPSVLNGMLH